MRLHGVMAEVVAKMREAAGEVYQGHCIMKMSKTEDTISALFSDNSICGELNTQLTESMLDLKLLDNPSLEFEAVANLSTVIDTIGKAEKANDAVVRVDINMYGPRSSLKELGKKLSGRRIFLQRPNYWRHGVPYDNPHFLKLPHVEVNQTANPMIPQIPGEKGSEMDKEEEFKRTIGNVYASLTRSRKLHGLEGDGRLRTPLLEYVAQCFKRPFL